MSMIIPAATNRSLLGTIGGLIGGTIGFIGGGPGGAVAGAQAGQAIGNAVGGSPGGPTPPAGNTGGASAGFGGFSFPGLTGGTSSSGTGNAPGQCAPGVAKCNPCGVYGHGSHLNTRTLQPTKKHGVQLPGTWCVRRRHMNATNFKALRRADRRAHAFLRISKRVTRHFVAKQPKGRGYVHFKKRSR